MFRATKGLEEVLSHRSRATNNHIAPLQAVSTSLRRGENIKRLCPMVASMEFSLIAVGTTWSTLYFHRYLNFKCRYSKLIRLTVVFGFNRTWDSIWFWLSETNAVSIIINRWRLENLRTTWRIRFSLVDGAPTNRWSEKDCYWRLESERLESESWRLESEKNRAMSVGFILKLLNWFKTECKT